MFVFIKARSLRFASLRFAHLLRLYVAGILHRSVAQIENGLLAKSSVVVEVKLRRAGARFGRIFNEAGGGRGGGGG